MERSVHMLQEAAATLSIYTLMEIDGTERPINTHISI